MTDDRVDQQLEKMQQQQLIANLNAAIAGVLANTTTLALRVDELSRRVKDLESKRGVADG